MERIVRRRSERKKPDAYGVGVRSLGGAAGALLCQSHRKALMQESDDLRRFL